MDKDKEGSGSGKCSGGKERLLGAKHGGSGAGLCDDSGSFSTMCGGLMDNLGV